MASGAFLFDYFFFAQARESDPLAAGEWKSLLSADEELDYTRLLPRARWAIRYANVRSGFLPSQSRLRGNDEQKNSARSPDGVARYSEAARDWIPR